MENILVGVCWINWLDLIGAITSWKTKYFEQEPTQLDYIGSYSKYFVFAKKKHDLLGTKAPSLHLYTYAVIIINLKLKVSPEFFKAPLGECNHWLLPKRGGVKFRAIKDYSTIKKLEHEATSGKPSGLSPGIFYRSPFIVLPIQKVS